MVILLFPMGIVLSVFLNSLQQKLGSHKRWIGNITAGILLIFLYLDHLNLTDNSTFSISRAREFTASVPAPPEDCRIFFVSTDPALAQSISQRPQLDFEQTLVQLDAMSIASHFQLKTLNGYSGHIPRHWFLYSVFDADYGKHLEDWIKIQKITEPVYRYDLTEKKWHGPINTAPIEIPGSISANE